MQLRRGSAAMPPCVLFTIHLRASARQYTAKRKNEKQPEKIPYKNYARHLMGKVLRWRYPLNIPPFQNFNELANHFTCHQIAHNILFM